MKKLIWATTVFVLFLIFVLPGLMALLIDFVPAEDQPPYRVDEKVSVYGKIIISQEFVSQEKNLSAIGISLGNPNLKNKKMISLNLYDAQDKLLRESNLNGQNFEDGDFVKFFFPTIADSKGKNYRFTISSPEAGPEEVIYVFYTPQSPSWMGHMFVEDQIFDGATPFVTFHKPESRLSIVNKMYSRFLPFLR